MTEQTFRCRILTPYLTEALECFANHNPIAQIQKYGFQENNLKDIPILETDSHSVLLAKEKYGNNCDRLAVEREEIIQVPTQLIIAGSTIPGEEEVWNLRKTGIPVARFSTFYGRVSGYSGKRPEAGAYAFDIPKDVDTVKTMLTHDPTLDALLRRDANAVREALANLNQGLNKPIIATSFLEEALNR